MVPLMKSRWSQWLAAVLIAAAATTVLGCGTVSRSAALESDQPAGIDYDPWVRFNEQAFWFNHDVLDRYALKPAATVWHEAVPDLVSQSLGHAFDNLDGPKRLVNNMLQGRDRRSRPRGGALRTQHHSRCRRIVRCSNSRGSEGE